MTTDNAEPTLSSLAATVAAHESWAKTKDRSARTAPARDAFKQKFLDQANGDPVVAQSLESAHYARLALKSAQARRKKRDAHRMLAEIAEAAAAAGLSDDDIDNLKARLTASTN